ncbi:MAG TPA: helix-turn-helix domain-containing protein [Stenomitos sp.]
MPLSQKQIRAAELLAKGYSQEEVGKAVGASRRSVSRWLQSEEFRNLSYGLVGRASQPPPRACERQSEGRQMTSRLNPEDLVPDALEAVRGILQDPDCRNADRLKAASLIGEWAGLGNREKMAEMEALKVLIEAGWIGDAPVNVLVENWQILSAEMKEALRGNGAYN